MGIVLFAPPSVLHNWEKEIQALNTATRIVKDIKSSMETSPVKIDWNTIFLVSYGAATSAKKAARSKNLNSPTKSIGASNSSFEPHLPPCLKSHKFAVMILDEGHHVNNASTFRWKAINTVQTSFTLLVTATPMMNSEKELLDEVELMTKMKWTVEEVQQAQLYLE